MPGSDEKLRKEWMLLSRHERELFELRKERGRTETWLSVFHQLSLNLNATLAASLIERWVSAMVDGLVFQVAAVHTYDPRSSTLRLLECLAPRPLANEVALESPVYDFLVANPSGHYLISSPEPLSPLGRELELGMFYWMLLPSRRDVLLLTAGFATGTEAHREASKQDLPHFVQLAKHLAALLENAQLIAELDAEKSDLSASNARLDIHLTELRETQEKLVESSKLLAEVSRRAGMADVATGILHNVGNALNSVNVSIEVLAEKLQHLKLSGVGKVAELLSGESENLARFLACDERGRKLPAYLLELASHLGDDRAGMEVEIEALRKHVEHMKAIVGKQQSHAMTMDVAQAYPVSELVDDALGLCEHGLAGLGIEVSRRYLPVPTIVTDRHKVLQILVNLISNAKYALSEPGWPQRKLELSVAPRADAAGVAIAVRDSGVGILRENLQRLFRYGYTTKPDGHGFGLHTSAIAARELGGKLSGASPGAGEGASFVLELPLDIGAPRD
jgi:signal transduction histidine kinase